MKIQALLGAAILALCVRAEAAAISRPHILALDLVPAYASVRPGEPARVALRFVLEPGWHVYWKNPGDSGEPVRVVWTLPDGVEGGVIDWPAPSRIAQPPLANYGYEGELFLPFRLQIATTAQEGTSLPLKAKVSWLVCREACIPGKAELFLSLPVSKKTPRPTAWFKAINDTLGRVPAPSSQWTVSSRLTPESIVLDVQGPKAVSRALYFPYCENALKNGEEQRFEASGSGFTLTLARSNLFSPERDSLDGVLELEDDPARAIDVSPRPAAARWTAAALLQAVLFGFLGGVLLNLMPCVLPVLFLKVLSLGRLSTADRGEARLHSHAYSAGILAAFWTLAGVLWALRAAGERLGWGFQLQSPVFLTLLAFLFFALALNLMGLYEIGASWMGIGQSSVPREGLAGAFFSGVLAVVVATPCTAPFMGTALGFALTAPAAVAFLVFTWLALGLALPYAAVAHFPALSRWVPKPGAWMEGFKQLLSFPLLATVLWLLSVLGLQSGAGAVIHVLAFLLLFAFALWLYGKQARSAAAAALALTLAAAAAWGGAAAAKTDLTRGPLTSETTPQSDWGAFSPAAVKTALAEGRPVFVDFTAAWCITCQVNERLVLDTAPVLKKFREKNVLPLRADWTNRSAEIADQLQRYGRAGVPLYVLYRPGAKEPEILPQLLTPDSVLRDLDSF